MTTLKKLLFIATLLLGSYITKAQVTDVITGLPDPTGMTSKGNDLYVIIDDTATFALDRVVKIDVTAATPVTTDVVIDISGTDIAIENNDLYIAGSSEVNKMDITAPLPVNGQNTTRLGVGKYSFFGTNGIAIKNNFLYVAEQFGDKISRVNLTPDVHDTLLNYMEPGYLTVDGNFLYISDDFAKKISRINITSPTPTAVDAVTNLAPNNVVRGIAVHGTDIYFAQSTEIRKASLSSIPATTYTVVANMSPFFPRDLEIINNVLYISSDGDKISKLQLGPLSVSNQESKLKIIVYPNPTFDYVKTDGLAKPEDYSLFNLDGIEIQKGTLSNTTPIDMRNLPTGNYLLKINNQGSVVVTKD